MDPDRPRAARWLWNGFRAAFHPDGVRAVIIADRVIVTRLHFEDPSRVDEVAFGGEWSPVTLGGLAPQLIAVDGDRRLLTVRADGRVSSFDLETRVATWIRHAETAAVLTGITHAVNVVDSSVGLISRGEDALIVDGEHNTASTSAELGEKWRALNAIPLLSAAWDRWSGYLVGGTESGDVVLVNRAARPRVVGRHVDAVSFVQIDREARSVITASDDGTVAEWALRDGQKRWHCTGATVKLVSAGRTATGDVVATSASGGFHVWRGGDARPPRVTVARGAVAACVSAGGRIGFSLREDHTIELWDTRRNVRLAVVEGDAEGVEDVAFVGDGRRIVARIGDELREWVIEECARE